MASKAIPLALAGGGAILIWSGLKGKSWSTVLRDVISGQNPSNAASTNAITQTTNAPSTTISSTSANAALTGSGPYYSYSELESLWEEAGGSSSLAPTMAAIAMAESSGNANAHNPSGASGLWQIMIPANAQYVPGGASNVYNPLDNAIAAVGVYNAQGLGAWTTYTSGAYEQYLQ